MHTCMYRHVLPVCHQFFICLDVTCCDVTCPLFTCLMQQNASCTHGNLLMTLLGVRCNMQTATGMLAGLVITHGKHDSVSSVFCYFTWNVKPEAARVNHMLPCLSVWLSLFLARIPLEGCSPCLISFEGLFSLLNNPWRAVAGQGWDPMRWM